MRTLVKWTTLALWGGNLYYALEAVYKTVIQSGGMLHWTMGVLGAVLFVALGHLSNQLPWRMSLALQGACGALLVTVVELVAGLVLNVWLGLGIWDYSHLPLNLWGQICPQYTLMWWPLSIFAIVLFDWLHYYLGNGELPHYHLF